MKQKILKIVTVLMVIATLTMSNFALICVNAITYAVDTINADKTTNNKNVEFEAYFKNENGEKVSNLDTKMNAENLKLYFQIAVKKEGLLDGEITLKDSNFKFKEDFSDNSIRKIEENKIYLNQINAGETKEIEINIELLKQEQFDLGLINMESKILLEGTYKNSTQKDISISATRTLKLNMVNPYDSAEKCIKLSEEIITNKVVKYNGEDKRIVQVQITSGINNNLFPIKSSIIKVQAPKVSDKYPEALISANKTLATNGKKLTQENYNYNSETGLATIEINNTAENNQITWKRSGEDKIIVTYIFDKDVEIKDEKISVTSEINLYDTTNTKVNATSTIQIGQDEKDSIITTEIKQNEENIYKGKLYAGINRDITYTTIINSNLAGVVNKINLVEKEQEINNNKIDSTYRTTIINKENVLNILGNNGELLILNAENNEQIAKVNADSETNADGNIIVNYGAGTSEIKIETTAPQNTGDIELTTTKTIGKIQKDIVQTATEISTEITGDAQTTKSTINLKETETKANLQLNKTEFSTMSANNVEMRVTLNSREENNDLYKNPTIRIQLPQTVQNVDVNSIQLVDEEELKITSQKILDGNVLEIKLNGEQTNYKDKAIEGAILILNMNITLDKKQPSTQEQIVLTCINGEKTVQEKVTVNFVSYAGLVTINRMEDYGVEVINNQGNKEVTLPINSRTRTVNNTRIENEIINNEENEIKNVSILGTFPTKDAIEGNNFDISVGKISATGIDESRIKVYYSENANATKDISDSKNGWSENIADAKKVKKYLIIIDKLAVREGIKVSYDIQIPQELEYNLTAKHNYTVYYTIVTSEKEVTTDDVEINTEKGATLDVSLKAQVASKEVDTVKEGEIIRYVVTVSNTGSEDIANAKITAKVPENTVLIDSNKLNSVDQIEDDDEGEGEEEQEEKIELDSTLIEANIDKIEKGQTVTKYYEVRVKKGTAGNVISNNVQLQYGEVQKTSNEVKTSIEQGEITVLLRNTEESSTFKNGYNYRYLLTVTNESNKKINNAVVTINNPTEIKVSKMLYITDKTEYVNSKNTNTLTIKELDAGSSITVAVYIVTNMQSDEDYKDTTITAKVTANNKDYNSNELGLRIENDTKGLNMTVTSANSGSYVKAGDRITYRITVENKGINPINKIKVNNWVSNEVTLKSVTRNNIILSENDYDFGKDDEKLQKLLTLSEDTIEVGETITYDIEVQVNTSYNEGDIVQIINETNLQHSYNVVKTAKVEHILKTEENNNNNGNSGNNDNNSNNGNNNNNGNTNNGDNNSTSSTSYVISGTAWVDKNENGQKDSDEELLQGIKVKLINAKTNEYVKDSNGNVLEATTNSEGFYSFNKIEKGQYLVIFEYDTSIYGITTFEKEGISNENNSNVIEKTITIDGKEVKVGATEKLDLTQNLSGINIGLILGKKYDMQLDKYVTKVIVQNSKTTTTDYEDAKLAKQEINAKEVNSTTVIVEYKIKVTNNGEVAGYVKKIADYLSSDYKFSSELNKDWYQDKDTVYCTSLSDIKINPGESKEVKLTVIKQMKEDNIGLINNTAEIVNSYNELGLTDINSTEGNKVKGENDMSSADVIISIKTGQVVTTIILVITTIVLIGAALYIIRRIIINRNII